MTITNLTPSAEYTYGGGSYTGGSADYTNLTDASDTSYLVLAGANSYVSYPLTDALEILSVTAATVNIRCRNGSSKGDFAKLESVQIFASDGTTAVTSIANQSSTITATTYNLTFSSITLDDITSWNGAVVKVKIDGGTGTGIHVFELSVDITYTPNPDRVASGGVKLGYTSPSRYSATYNSGSGNWTVPYDVTTVHIDLWGSGGGGGASTADVGGNIGGGGGGGGGYCRKYDHAVTPSGTVAYVIGTIGAGGTGDSNDATNGGNSTVAGGTYTANGGAKGGFAGAGGGVGGTASGGDTNTTGTTGSTNATIDGGNGGAGAGSFGNPGGAGGAGDTIGLGGGVGIAPAGGGGGGGFHEFGAEGGDGALGRVIFSYDTVLTFTPGPNRMSGLIGTSALSSIINNAMVVPINFPAN